MSNKKLHLLIFGLLLTILFVLQSCEKKVLKTHKKQNNTAEIDTLIATAYKYYDTAKFDSSYFYFNKVKYAAIKINDTSRIIHSIGWMAEIELNLGDYTSCENTATHALPYLKNTEKYPYGTWTIYNVLGSNYLQQFDYVNAHKYFNKTLNLKTDEISKYKTKNNIANVYIREHDYLKAMKILFPLTLEEEIINENELFSVILSNLGVCYFKTGNPKALDYLSKGLKISKQSGDDFKIIENYNNLAEFHLKKNSSISKKYALLAYKKATKINDINDRLISLSSLIHTSTGYQSKKYALDYIRINDSIIKASQMARNQFAKIKYDSKQVRGENQKLKIERVQNGILIVEQKNRILLLLLLITTTIATTLLIINFLSCKNRKEKIQTSIDTETRISKKLHDEVANDVYLTMAFAETQDLSTTQNKEILLSNLDNIYSATRSISRENNSINQNENFLEELKELLSEFNSTTTNILVNGLDDIDWTAIENIKKITIYRVLQELLINMKKHSKCCLAVIIFKKNKNNLEINYSDNGAGAPIDKITSGNGLQNVINRILDIKGNITFDTSPLNGFKSSITIPI